jgi:hypothetical protein
MLGDISTWGTLEFLTAIAAGLAVADSISQRIKAWLKARDIRRERIQQFSEDSKLLKALDQQTKDIKADFTMTNTKVDGVRQEIVEVREVNDERHRENQDRLKAIEEREGRGK